MTDDIRHCAVFTALVGLLAATSAAAELESRIARDADILATQESDTNLTVIVASRQGQLSWNDVFRGLARAGGLDEEAVSGEFDHEQLDLTQRRTCLSILAFSAAIPDVRLRVIEHPVTKEPALLIRLERDDLHNKIRRLKSSIRERFGREDGTYGLQLDHRWNQLPTDRPLVVLIHGYSSNRQLLDGFRSRLVESGWPCATFVYPNDGPLAEAGKLLARELSDFRERFAERGVAIVAHSMGGLVARAAIEDPELDPGNVRQLIMVCTPNHGSQWAELPGGLDCWEHLPQRAEQTLQEALRASVSDGLNEARADLKPDSKFLRELNARKRHPNVAHSLILGSGAPFTASQIAQLQQSITRSLVENRSGRIVLPRVKVFFDNLHEMEQGKGDWVVSVERGRLEGVADTLVLPITHWAFTHEQTQSVQGDLHRAIQQRLRDAWLR